MAKELGNKRSMNINPHILNIGSIVKCVTCFDKVIEGEVLALDSDMRLLTLKCRASNGESNHKDVIALNMNYIKSIDVVKDSTSENPHPIPFLSIHHIRKRLTKSLNDRKHLLQAGETNATPAGRSLFIRLSKNLQQQVKWDGKDIALGGVRVTPPYQLANIKIIAPPNDADTKGAAHIRKLVSDPMLDYWKNKFCCR